MSNWADPGQRGRSESPTWVNVRITKVNWRSIRRWRIPTENPPPEAHGAAITLLRRGGIVVGEPCDGGRPSDPMRRGLARAAQDGPQIMKRKLRSAPDAPISPASSSSTARSGASTAASADTNSSIARSRSRTEATDSSASRIRQPRGTAPAPGGGAGRSTGSGHRSRRRRDAPPPSAPERSVAGRRRTRRNRCS